MRTARAITPLTEFFTLARAERTVRAYAPLQHTHLRAYFEAGMRRLSAGRRLTQPVPSAILFRQSVFLLLLAAEVARDETADPEALACSEIAAAMPELPPDPAHSGAVPSDDAIVRSAVTATDPLYFDRLAPDDADRVRDALERAASVLSRRLEARSLANVAGTRWGRTIALVVVVGYALVAGVRAAVLPVDVALHKPVLQSSVGATPPSGHTIVDGELGSSYGVHTGSEDSPSVMIDLLDTYRIDRVQVHNRIDGWFDDCLPLVLELSTDGKTFDEIARREQHFDGTPPWVVHAYGRAAHYIRLRIPRRGYLVLSQVEVFGKKKR
jgi:hypothetical protein